jgi:hypothetical protein
MTICTCGMGPIGGCRVCDAPMPHAGDTPEERAAFLKWWEGQAHWSGSPCAVAYQGWLARATMVESARGGAPDLHLHDGPLICKVCATPVSGEGVTEDAGATWMHLRCFKPQPGGTD